MTPVQSPYQSSHSSESLTEDSFSEFSEEDNKPGHAQGHRSRQQRCIVATASLSKAQEASGHQRQQTITGGTQAFNFLANQCFSCTCLSSSLFSPSAENCMVLQFFHLEYICIETHGSGVIFCCSHNSFVPASDLAAHLCKRHNDWSSPKKKEESRNIADHIVATCGLDMEQVARDVLCILPIQLDQPLDQTGVYHSIQCPFCDCWMAKNKSGGSYDRLMRKNHFPHCPQRPGSSNVNERLIAEPRFTYRANISGGASHVFLLPEDWTEEDLNNQAQDDIILPIFKLPCDPQALQGPILAVAQDWPIHLGWEIYAKEIGLDEHFNDLKKLIGPCKKGYNFLEKGLIYLQSYLIRYLKEAGHIIEGSVVGLAKLLVSE